MVRFSYIFSLSLLLFFSIYSYGQDKDSLYAPIKEKEPLVLNGMKVGINIGRFSDYLFKPERTSYEASFDFNLSNKYFGVIEGGLSETNIKKDNYQYSSEGTFVKAGVDFNMLKKYPSDYFGIGVRLGRAAFKHSATKLTYENIHWPTQSLSIDSKSYTTYWLEVSLGIKGELLKNVYFGWSALVRVGISGRKDEQFQPYNIPGFGKGTNAINLGANYYIYYQIPFNKNK